MWTNLLGLDALVQTLLGSSQGEQEHYNREEIKKYKFKEIKRIIRRPK